MQISDDVYFVKHSIVLALATSSPRCRQLMKRELSGMLDIAFEVLGDDIEGARIATIGDPKYPIQIQANHIGFIDWLAMKRICQLTEQYDMDALNEGYTFNFEMRASLDDLELPNCDCSPRGYEIGDTVTIRGNQYDSNADTYATQLGIKAERMYLFWITEEQQYGIVRLSYWCM